MQFYFTDAAKKKKKSSHLELREQTFSSVQHGYLIVQIQIQMSIFPNQDLSSSFEKCVSSLLWQPQIH